MVQQMLSCWLTMRKKKQQRQQRRKTMPSIRAWARGGRERSSLPRWKIKHESVRGGRERLVRSLMS